MTTIKRSFLRCLPMEVMNELPTDIVAAMGESVLSNNAISLSDIQPCTQKEAGTRGFLHVNHVANRDLKNVILPGTIL